MKETFFKLDEDFETIIKNTLKNKEINKLNFITTGWTNIVYEVEANDGKYFFRFPRDDFWARTIIKDYEFANYIYDKTDFNTVKLELHFDKGRPFSVHKKIEGTPLASKMNTLSQAEVEECGKDIAKFMYELHNMKYDEQKIFNKTNNIGIDLPEYLNELLTLHVSKEDIKFWDNAQIKKDNKCKKLVHGDLNSSNILLDKNNKVTAILDFGFGGFGDEYDDISRIIGRCPANFKKEIVKGYEECANKELNMKILDNKINDWNNIDNGYINYMRSIGIYE